MSDDAPPNHLPTFELEHDPWGQLVLVDAEGVRHEGVAPVRGFPISDPKHWVSICNEAGKELVCIDDLSRLPPQVRQVLEEDLARREFVPVIQRILRASGDTEPCEWDVETDRGITRFVLDSEDDVRRTGPHSGMVIDSNGIRYLISDVRQLDAKSLQIVQAYL